MELVPPTNMPPSSVRADASRAALLTVRDEPKRSKELNDIEEDPNIESKTDIVPSDSIDSVKDNEEPSLRNDATESELAPVM